MLNASETYYECGRACGRARKRSDESLARFEQQWFYRAVALEALEDRAPATRLFEAGYREGRGIPAQ